MVTHNTLHTNPELMIDSSTYLQNLTFNDVTSGNHGLVHLQPRLIIKVSSHPYNGHDQSESI